VDAGYEDFLALKGKIPGFFPVDKPAGRTSRDVVDIVMQTLGVDKAGHTGTLDPFATGVLVIATGKASKVLKYTEDWDKEYEGTVLLGVETDTYDTTGNVVAEMGVPVLTEEIVSKALERFVGEIVQYTPPVSAAKVRGMRLYERARRGERLSPPRIVTIHSIEVMAFRLPRITLRVHCGRGTYVRSVAHELGLALGTVGALESLRRTREGPFEVKDCISLIM
jgi:tRNA pseudouridine55 synthase